MIKKALTTLVILLVLVNISCQERYPDLEDGIYAEIETNKGTMVAKLFYDKVPVTVANFVALAEGNHPMAEEKYKGKPFYDSITFHRVMDQFMIQGGDPTATGSGTPGYRFTADFSPDLKHDKPGILSMANSGGLNTNGSQFFITERPYPRGDAFDAQGNMKPCERNGVSCHSVFGELVKGLEVQDSISNVKVAARNKPVEDVIITKLNIIRKGKDAKFFNAPKIFQEEMPKVEENLNKIKEEAKKKADAKTAAATAETLASFNDYKSKTTTSATGLMTYIITKGSGPKVKQGDNVKLWYEGYFTNGKLLDSNRQELEDKFGMLNPQKVQRGMYIPMQMTITPDAQLFAGFKEAAANMSVGEKVFVYVPSHLAYGESGRAPTIQPNTDLVFILEMLEIEN